MSCCTPANPKDSQKSCCGGGSNTCGGGSRPGEDNLHKSVQEFYTNANERSDLASAPPPCSAACPLDPGYPQIVHDALKLIHPDVIKSYFGCGMPYPHGVEGCKIMDLGSGTGRDCFLLAYLAGKDGKVIGIDMTPAMLEKSRFMIPYHKEKFGFENVEFRQGFLEKLDEVENVQMGTYDIIISNCVINLAKDKRAVFQHAFNLLKPGGELCFSDVYTDKQLPREIIDNERLWNECYSGALPYDNFVSMNREIGFLGPFTIKSTDYVAYTPELGKLIEGLRFWSKTERLFKPGTSLNKTGGSLTYLGTLTGAPDEFEFAETLIFKKGIPVEVEVDVYNAIKGSRFGKHFDY